MARQLAWQANHWYLYSQVVIPRQDSIRIAKDLEIRHPRFPGGIPSVRTLDFVHLATDGVYTAYSVKASPESLSPFDLRMMAIERRYCEEVGFDWCSKFKSQVNATVIRNIRWIEGNEGISPLIYGSEQWRRLEPTFHEKVTSGKPLNRACATAERKLRLPPTSGLTLVRFFIANRIWSIDWETLINPFTPLSIVGRNLEVQL